MLADEKIAQEARRTDFGKRVPGNDENKGESGADGPREAAPDIGPFVVLRNPQDDG